MDLNSINENVNRLIQNISEQNRKANEIFFDIEPKDVELQQIDDNGVLQTITLPNRAKILADVSLATFDKADSTSPVFEKVTPYSFVIKAGCRIKVNDKTTVLTSDYSLDININLDTGTKTPGLDYFVYAKEDGTFYISADNTIATDRLIGGFHYSLVAEDEAATGNKTEDDMVAIRGINKYSFWDLKFRPNCDPRGMVYVLGRWYDIYLSDSNYGIRKYSAPSVHSGFNIAAGATDYSRQIPKIPLEFGGDGTVDYGSYTWFQACEVVGVAGKQLIKYEEFQKIAYGVVEGARAHGTYNYDTDDNEGKVTHYPEFVSKWGIEQASGNEWIWGADVGGNRDEGSTDWAWRDKAGGRGQIYALHDNHITAVRLGGQRDESDGMAGSRCSDWNGYVWYSYWSSGSRASCDHLKLV